MYYTVEIASKTIMSAKLTRLVLFDGNSADKVFSCEGTPESLCAELYDFVSKSNTMVRAEAGAKGDIVDAGGKVGKLAQRQPYVWRIMGTAGGPAVPVPVAGAVDAKAPAGYMSIVEHKQALELAALQEQMRQLTHCQHGVHVTAVCAVCDSEEAEEEEEEEEVVPKSAEIQGYVAAFREVIGMLSFGKVSAPAPSAITGAASEPVSGPVALEGDDLETWRAIQAMKASNPEMFDGYRSELIKNFGHAKQ